MQKNNESHCFAGSTQGEVKDFAFERQLAKHRVAPGGATDGVPSLGAPAEFTPDSAFLVVGATDASLHVYETEKYAKIVMQDYRREDEANELIPAQRFINGAL